MRIELPLPPRALSPNARTHWAPKARAVRLYRQLAFLEAKAAGAGRAPAWERAELRATFCVPDARRRDPDNLIASIKSAIDGIVDSGLLTDDRYLILHPPQIVVDRESPRLELDITRAKEGP